MRPWPTTAKRTLGSGVEFDIKDDKKIELHGILYLKEKYKYKCKDRKTKTQPFKISKGLDFAPKYMDSQWACENTWIAIGPVKTRG